MAQTIPNILADEARADGLHDFGPNGPKTNADDGRKNAFATSIVGMSLNAWDEDQSLNAAFVSNPANPVNARSILAGLRDGEKIAVPQAITGHTYTVKRVVFVGSPDANAKTGRDLAEQIGLNGTVLQVDFNHHSFLSRLKTGPAAPEIQVGYIWSAATINDPASKTPPHDEIFKAGGNGIVLNVHQQISGSTTFSGGQSYDSAIPTKNFVSAYDIELSGITKKVSFGRREKDTVTIKFTHPPTKRNVIISDSKGQNSPAQLNGFITKLLASLGSDKAKFELSTKWQQKRSGDWFQVLHASLLKTMKFNPPLPKGFHVFFVSHDRIAIAYALLMGVSCLYFADDSVYVFDNRPEDQNAANERCRVGLEAIGAQQQQVLDKWFFGETPRGKRHIDGMNDTRNTKLQVFDGYIKTGCDKLRTIGSATPSIQTLGDLEKTLKNVLSDALRRVFLEKAFPDADTLREGKESAEICTRYKAYATLDSLYKQHAGGKTIPPTFFGQFEKTMVFKTLSEWKLEPSQNISSRIINFIQPGSGDSDIRDSFAFFPFIQNSGNAELKNYIADTFEGLLPVLNAEKLETMGARTPSRQTRVMLGLSNILKQGHVYLKTAPVSDADNVSLANKFNAVSKKPDIKQEPAAPAIANRMTLRSAVRSKLSKQAIPDTPDENMDGGKQLGGWEEGVRLAMGTELDFDQCADPLLYAFIDCYYVLSSVSAEQNPEAAAEAAELERDMLVREGEMFSAGVRRPLYGAAAPTVTQTVTMTEQPSASVDHMSADIINGCVLLTAQRIVRDSWKLDGAPENVVSYYAKASSLMSALADAQATPSLAKAVYELISYSAYMKDAEFAAAFSMNPEEASVMRLHFSAMEENPPLIRPTEPAKNLLAAKNELTKMWSNLSPIANANSESIRVLAEKIKQKIGDRYGITESTFPGMGVPLAPGAKVLTPEEVRQSRIAALTPKTPSNIIGGRRRTRRRARLTSP